MNCLYGINFIRLSIKLFNCLISYFVIQQLFVPQQIKLWPKTSTTSFGSCSAWGKKSDLCISSQILDCFLFNSKNSNKPKFSIFNKQDKNGKEYSANLRKDKKARVIIGAQWW